MATNPGASNSPQDGDREITDALIRDAEAAYGAIPNESTSRKMFAHWLSRVACFVADAAIPLALIMLGSVLGRPTYSTDPTGTVEYDASTGGGYQPAYYVLLALAVVFVLWNRGWQEGRTGRSVGKQLLGFATVKESTGRPIGVWLATLRVFLLVVDFAICYVGVLWPLWDSKRQCLLSDKLTGAIVIPARV
ncbi:MAG: RDD family protein [Actinobacteria bacterium]|nr:RDD family protein [Actinomycetota bacterium]